MIPIDIYQPGNRLVVEHLANQVKECAERHTEQLCLVTGQREAAHRLMSQKNEIRQDGHCYAGVVPLNDLVGVELPPAPGGCQRELPAVPQDDALSFIPTDAAHNVLRFCQLVFAFIAPDIYALWSLQNRQPGEIALYANALYLLNAAFEVPGPVAVSQYAPALWITFAALGAKMQSFFYRDEHLLVVRRGALDQAQQIILFVILPFPERILGAYRQLAPSDQAIRILAPGLRIPGVAHTPLVDDFMIAPAIGQEGQHFGYEIAPGFFHIVHTGPHKLGGVPVCFISAGLLDIPLGLPHQHFRSKKNGADDLVIFRHLFVDLYTLAALQLPQKFLVYPSSVEAKQPGFAVLPEFVHRLCHLLLR